MPRHEHGMFLIIRNDSLPARTYEAVKRVVSGVMQQGLFEEIRGKYLYALYSEIEHCPKGNICRRCPDVANKTVSLPVSRICNAVTSPSK